MESEHHRVVAGPELAGLRLDAALAEAIEDASRSLIQKAIKDGHAKVDGQLAKRPSRAVLEGAVLEIDLPPPLVSEVKGEPIPLDVLYEDADVLMINKAAGMVVHPAPGHRTGTLVHAVLHHCPDLANASDDPLRPGIVHRLDRDTSGVMVVAKTPRAWRSLAKQASEHSFERRYVALVRGDFEEDSGRIEAQIGRSLADPSRMAVTGVRGRRAVTHFEVIERYGIATRLGLVLETGRTHQIRVHMRFANRPVLGDPVYGVTDFRKWALDDGARQALTTLHGQALHAERLGVTHPVTGERIVRTAPPPADFDAACAALRRGMRDLRYNPGS